MTFLPKDRLKSARERLNKTPQEVALAAGINESSYYDLENIDEEIELGVTLLTLQKICQELKISPSSLFSEAPTSSADKISVSELTQIIRSRLTKDGISFSEFEDKVGFKIASSLNDAHQIMDWSIECLRSVCEEVGVDWQSMIR